MAPKIGPSVNVPTTDPLWTDQRLVDGKDLTPEELKISKEQSQAMTEVVKTLKTPVQKGDSKGARARVDSLQKQFEGLSPDNKKYMYKTLQMESGLATDFKYRLSTPSRDKLLKTLNPDHKEEHITEYTITDAKEKAQKVQEMKMQEQQKQNEVFKSYERQMQEFDKELKDIRSKLGQ